MHNDRSVTHDDSQERDRRLRVLNHDIKNSLAVVALGLQALRSVRMNEEQFEEVLSAIEGEGVEGVKAKLASLVSMAREISDKSEAEVSEEVTLNS